MRRAVIVVVFLMAGCASSRAQVLVPLAPARLCLKALPGRAPTDVVQDVLDRVESGLAAHGLTVVHEPPCEQQADIALVGGYPWLFGWVAERLTMRVRDSSGRLLATIEQSAPMGGTYVFYMVDPFVDAIVAAFAGKR